MASRDRPRHRVGVTRITTLDDLCRLCRAHHHLKTYRGLKVTRNPDGTWAATMPNPPPPRPPPPDRPTREPVPPDQLAMILADCVRQTTMAAV